MSFKILITHLKFQSQNLGRYNPPSGQERYSGFGRSQAYSVSLEQPTDFWYNFSDPNGKKLGEYGGKIDLRELKLWVARKPR